ncbi:alpha-amylase family protein [Shewanella sp. 202IG2-18]|uniref:alpha-amylase family protein n=1 Tax=Parashewanella hymeniacidonis TaxID=2807618 RepID=UPI0019601D97|nr:alpha-amylase family protein [Parashewanella hymeniacidonis]MBM7073616.1 alpha-amylase family protein [Parashewanella hymeniacidonis]
MKKTKSFLLSALSLCITSGLGLTACSKNNEEPQIQVESQKKQQGKVIVYQMFTRLFGNTKTTNKEWGTVEENGVGKFNDIDDTALKAIKDLGANYVWYTGVLHHDLVRDYTAYGISNDDPEVIKGRAGSPYAVKDYYNVNPDLAVDPANRLQEFEALVARTHSNGLKAVIDIVPNHIARNYKSLSKPEGVEDFGESDNSELSYAKHNNFYYVKGEDFKLPEWLDGYQVLGGEKHPMIDGEFTEKPAKWTGNGSRKSQPHFHDWYETVKVNYGVRPDGSYDFPTLPAEYADKDVKAHFEFWQGKEVPSSWVKFKDIALYWTAKGVDGFRYDMAEMVPVEFWSYMNSHIKMKNPDAFLLAEIYQPKIYRDFIHLGKMDYLYDKVDLYDRLKEIIQDKRNTDVLDEVADMYADIDENLLHFLENHDEQRIASPEFAGAAENALPAMVVSATMGKGPTMIYFGQTVGEKGEKDAGFGKASRTSIFDYWGVPAHQQWMNGGKFDGALLSADQKALQTYYRKLLNFTRGSSALMGEFISTHKANQQSQGYNGDLYSYVRFDDKQKLVVMSNFSQTDIANVKYQLPVSVVSKLELKDGEYRLIDRLNGGEYSLAVKDGVGSSSLSLNPLMSRILEVQL